MVARNNGAALQGELSRLIRSFSCVVARLPSLRDPRHRPERADRHRRGHERACAPANRIEHSSDAHPVVLRARRRRPTVSAAIAMATPPAVAGSGTTLAGLAGGSNGWKLTVASEWMLTLALAGVPVGFALSPAMTAPFTVAA